MASSGDRTLEEEFYGLLAEGSELLQHGAADDARLKLERALEIHPHHEQALNLLGLALFRLGQVDPARLIFANLVHQNPVEPSLRLNLAMVHLKTGRLDEARREVEEVIGIHPDHPRATSYMGLVLEKNGDLGGAADFYERAGNKRRADELRAHLPAVTSSFPLPNVEALTHHAREQDALRAAVARASSQAATTAQLAMPKPSHRPESSDASSSSELISAPAMATAPPVRRAPVPARELSEPLSASTRGGAQRAPPAAEEPTRTRLEVQTLAQLRAGAARAAVPDLHDDGLLAFPVQTAAHVRSDLVVSIAGTLQFEPVHRRYRGKRTDSLFGGAETAFVGLTGEGLALLHTDGLTLRAMSLESEELYLVEHTLLAFSHGLAWENGRLPSDADRDLDIVHLRGTGRLVMGARTPAAVMTVSPEAPAWVQAARLVGWTGQVVPCRVALPGLPDTARRVPVVRFEGSGLVLAGLTGS